MRLVPRILLRARPPLDRTWLSCGAREADGETLTALRPVGIVRLGGKSYEATAAKGVWLPAGVRVRVRRLANGRLLATPCTEKKP